MLRESVACPSGGSGRNAGPRSWSRLCSVFAPVARAAESSAERRLRQLEEEVKDLRREIEQEKAVTRAQRQQVQHATENAEVAKAKTTKAPDWLSYFTPFGDVRFRYEGFFNQPRLADQDVTANNRLRIRARVGMRFAYSDEIAATVRLASGNPNDPISTNQTLTGNFTPFSVNLDWAYLTVAPGKTFGIRPGLFTINGGKFPNPMFKVGELVFDDDLSPEGLNEIVQVLDQPLGDPNTREPRSGEALRRAVDLQPDQQPAGRVHVRRPGEPVHARRPVAARGGHRPVRVAQPRPDRPGDQPEHHRLHGGGRAGRERELQLLAGQHQPARGAAHSAAHAGRGQATRGVLRHDRIPERLQPDERRHGRDACRTSSQAQPLRFFFDFVHNWGAVGPDKANGFQVGLRVGQTKVLGDWSAYALYEYLQQDAVISAFSWSDFGLGGTNVKGPVIGLDYQLLNPLTLSARAYFTNFIDHPWVASQGTSNFVNNPTQTRLQLDAIMKF